MSPLCRPLTHHSWTSRFTHTAPGATPGAFYFLTTRTNCDTMHESLQLLPCGVCLDKQNEGEQDGKTDKRDRPLV